MNTVFGTWLAAVPVKNAAADAAPTRERRVDRVEEVEPFGDRLDVHPVRQAEHLRHAQVELRERRAAAAVDRLARADLLERRHAGIVDARELEGGRVDVVVDAVDVVVIAVPDVQRQRRAIAEDRRGVDAPRQLDDCAQRDLVPRVGARCRTRSGRRRRGRTSPARGWSSARRRRGRRGPSPSTANTTR